MEQAGPGRGRSHRLRRSAVPDPGQPQTGLFNYIIAFFTGADPSSFQMIGDVTLAPWSIVIVDVWMWTPYVMLICLAGLRSQGKAHLLRQGIRRTDTG